MRYEDSAEPLYEDKGLVIYKAISLERMEKVLILAAIEKTKGDKIKAAKILGIGKSTLFRRLKEYDSQGCGQEIEDAVERGKSKKLRREYTPPGNPEIKMEKVLPMESAERGAIFAALEATRNNKAAARLLNIGKVTLTRRLRDYSSQGDKEAAEYLNENWFLDRRL